MEARGTLKAMADSLRQTGMNQYETAQWVLQRYLEFRATLDRTRRARRTNGTYGSTNGLHPESNGHRSPPLPPPWVD
jgi:hypothetical protein